MWNPSRVEKTVKEQESIVGSHTSMTSSKWGLEQGEWFQNHPFLNFPMAEIPWNQCFSEGVNVVKSTGDVGEMLGGKESIT